MGQLCVGSAPADDVVSLGILHAHRRLESPIHMVLLVGIVEKLVLWCCFLLVLGDAPQVFHDDKTAVPRANTITCQFADVGHDCPSFSHSRLCAFSCYCGILHNIGEDIARVHKAHIMGSSGKGQGRCTRDIRQVTHAATELDTLHGEPQVVFIY